jgi:hypothetical protein
MNQVTQGYCLSKKTEGRKSRETVSLKKTAEKEFQSFLCGKLRNQLKEEIFTILAFCMIVIQNLSERPNSFSGG